MNEGWILPLVGWVSVLATLGLTVLVAANPAAGLARLTHRPEFLPQVMAFRYAGFALLALAAAILGDPRVLLALMLAFALVSFGDTWIYARAGHRHAPHLLAGIASLAGALLLLTAEA